MLVYALTIVGALVVAVGEVIQQRTAAGAPPEDNLSLRLLLWLVRRPRWLAGVGASAAGNVLFAIAVGYGSVALVEAVFVVRLLFALVLAAAPGRHRIPLRDVLGSLAITAGLVAFILAAAPRRGKSADVPILHWVVGLGCVIALALTLTAVARRTGPVRKAVLLGTGAGLLFGLQASLTQSAVRLLGSGGVVALLSTWNGYAVAVVALLGMLLVQSAFEAAPLAASYPAVVTTELVAGIAVAVGVLGGTVQLAAAGLAAAIVSLLVMIVGIYLLTTSPLVTGQLDELIRAQDVGLAARTEQRLARELQWAERALARGGGRGGGRRLRRELHRIDDGIARLCQLQHEIRHHRETELGRLEGLPERERARRAVERRGLLDRERAIDAQASRLREHADALTASIRQATGGFVSDRPGTGE